MRKIYCQGEEERQTAAVFRWLDVTVFPSALHHLLHITSLCHPSPSSLRPAGVSMCCVDFWEPRPKHRPGSCCTCPNFFSQAARGSSPERGDVVSCLCGERCGCCCIYRRWCCCWLVVAVVVVIVVVSGEVGDGCGASNDTRSSSAVGC